MLRELHIKNVAVIEEVRVEFKRGFNVLTGETGAGKSILIDSINMALGERCSRDIIRSGCDFALVDLCFEDESQAVKSLLEELGVEAEDGIILISRRLNADGKSVCRINGGMVPLSSVRQLAPLLIDIHGQNDNQSLMSQHSHLALLDEYGGLLKAREEYQAQYSQTIALRKELDLLNMDSEEKAHRLELASFQAAEIRAASLKAGEDEELMELRERLYNMESIVSGAGVAYGALYGSESGAAFDLLKTAERALSDVCRFDSKLSECYDRLTSITVEVQDIASDVNDCLAESDFSMAELDRIEERLDLIGALKRKYGQTIEEILEYGKNSELQAENIEKSDERLAELKEQLAKEMASLAASAEALSCARREAGKALEKRLAEELSAIDMPKVRLAIDISEKRDAEGVQYTQFGKDNVEFLISANPGESLKPLAKIASGGELSRIMLAIKSVLSQIESADTMIFDEIDTGVSGRAAQKIAEKIAFLAKEKQIFSITHLAQIAAMADSHYLIQKSSDDGKTATSVALLDAESRIDELARIVGGVSVTDLTRQNAREMLEMAREKKENN